MNIYPAKIKKEDTWQEIQKLHPEIQSFSKYEEFLITHRGFERVTRTGRIGGGSKLHNLRVLQRVSEDGQRIEVAECWSLCGSQRWSNSGRSRLTLIDGQCDCKKCLR